MKLIHTLLFTLLHASICFSSAVDEDLLSISKSEFSANKKTDFDFLFLDDPKGYQNTVLIRFKDLEAAHIENTFIKFLEELEHGDLLLMHRYNDFEEIGFDAIAAAKARKIFREMMEKKEILELARTIGIFHYDLSSADWKRLLFLGNGINQEGFTEEVIDNLTPIVLNLRYESISNVEGITGFCKNFSASIKKILQTKSCNNEESCENKKANYIKMIYIIDHLIMKEIATSFLPFIKSDFTSSYHKDNLKSLIYNNDGFEDDTKYPKHVKIKKGSALNDGKNPVGYVIFVPQGEIKNIIVDVYGGWQTSDLAKRLHRPLLPDDMLKEFLINNTAIVQLNLLDLLKNNQPQKQLSEILLKEMHSSIHYMHQLLREKSDTIHEDISAPKDTPIFLMGSSFGGFMSLYHATQYPRTFSGYISHAGGLHGEGYDPAVSPHINIAQPNHIEKIVDPIFLHHALDDNRVGARASLNFYRLAAEAQKENLVKLYISPHGNAFGVGSEPDLHGHFTPEGHYKKRYFEQLMDFINTKGTSIQPTLNLWRYKKYDTLIKRFNGLGYKVHNSPRDIDEVFLSKALQRYDSLFTTSENRHLITKMLQGDKGAENKLWEQFFAPLVWSIKETESDDPAHYVQLRIMLQKIIRQTDILNIIEQRIIDDIDNALTAVINDSKINNNKSDEIKTFLIKRVKEDFKHWLSDEKIDISHKAKSMLNKKYCDFIVSTFYEKLFPLFSDSNRDEVQQSLHAITQKELFTTFLKDRKSDALKVIFKKLKNYSETINITHDDAKKSG